MVHLRVLQKAKGQDAEHVLKVHVLNIQCLLKSSLCYAFCMTGVEEALQPHYRRDVPLHVAPPKDQQQDVLHRRTGKKKKTNSWHIAANQS